MFWILLLFLLILILTFAVGGSGEYLYHGSDKKIKRLEPRPSNVIKPDSAVFATPNYTFAVIFSAKCNDGDFSFNMCNPPVLNEQYPGAFRKLHATGYIHYLKSDTFKSDPRLQPDEKISSVAVDVQKVKKVNIYKELRGKAVLNEWATWTSKLKPATEIKSKIYIPISPHLRPYMFSHDDVFVGENMNPEETKFLYKSDECYLVEQFGENNGIEFTKARKKIYPYKSIVQRVIHIAGPGGVGKTTLGKRLSEKYQVIELDDYIGREQELKNMVLENAILIGLWFGSPEMNPRRFDVEKIYLTAEPETIYKRINGRIMQNIMKNSSELTNLIQNEPPEKIHAHAVMKYGVTQTFVENYDAFKQRLEQLEKSHANYRVMRDHEILKYLL